MLLLLSTALTVFADQSYTLKKGETLFRVSRRYDVPVGVLQRFNGITNPDTLPEGARIDIPSRYTVAKGDTLYSIARRHRVDLDDLMRFNEISDSARLQIGDVLYLPSSSAPAERSAPRSDQLWPHPGYRELLSGRITGALIHGALGDKVVSVSSGRVVWAGPYRGYSRVILIEGKNGYTYVYAGNEETLVTVGDTVVPGAEIGRLGNNVHQGEPRLYFLVYRNGKPVDPSLAPRS